MEVTGVPLKLRVTSHVRQLKVERNTSDPVHAGDVVNLHWGGLTIKPKFVSTYIMSLFNLLIMHLSNDIIKLLILNYSLRFRYI